MLSICHCFSSFQDIYISDCETRTFRITVVQDALTTSSALWSRRRLDGVLWHLTRRCVRKVAKACLRWSVHFVQRHLRKHEFRKRLYLYKERKPVADYGKRMLRRYITPYFILCFINLLFVILETDGCGNCQLLRVW